jgi:hypothetical protein
MMPETLENRRGTGTESERAKGFRGAYCGTMPLLREKVAASFCLLVFGIMKEVSGTA